MRIIVRIFAVALVASAPFVGTMAAAEATGPCVGVDTGRPPAGGTEVCLFDTCINPYGDNEIINRICA